MRIRVLSVSAAIGALLAAAAGNAFWVSPARLRMEEADRAADQPIEVSDLTRLLASNPAGCEVEDLPTELYRKVLGANEIIYKRYTTSALAFELYVARWRPGNPFADHAAGHPPEWCWPAVGWRCEESRSDDEFFAGDSRLHPGEWRRFAASNGVRQEVLFWCLVGDRLVRLGDRRNARTAVPISREGWNGFVLGSGFLRYWWFKTSGLPPTMPAESTAPDIPIPAAEEIYFVRLNSTSSMEAVLGSELFRHVQPVMEKLGLMNREQKARAE